jgi:hypothetical protein
MIQIRASRMAAGTSELFGRLISRGYMRAVWDLASAILNRHDCHILLMRITPKDAAMCQSSTCPIQARALVLASVGAGYQR